MERKFVQTKLTGEVTLEENKQEVENPCEGCTGDCYACNKRPKWKRGYMNSVTLKKIYGRAW
jgi:hypothetical protein